MRLLLLLTLLTACAADGAPIDKDDPFGFRGPVAGGPAERPAIALKDVGASVEALVTTTSVNSNVPLDNSTPLPYAVAACEAMARQDSYYFCGAVGTEVQCNVIAGVFHSRITVKNCAPRAGSQAVQNPPGGTLTLQNLCGSNTGSGFHAAASGSVGGAASQSWTINLGNPGDAINVCKPGIHKLWYDY